MLDEAVTVQFSTIDQPRMLLGFDGLPARVVDGRIQLIRIPTRGIASQRLDFDDLKAKFGEPKTYTELPFQTLAGGEGLSILALWQLPDGVEVTFTGELGSVDQGLVIIATPKGTTAFVADGEKQLRRGRSL